MPVAPLSIFFTFRHQEWRRRRPTSLLPFVFTFLLLWRTMMMMMMLMSFTKLVTKISSKCPLLLVEYVFMAITCIFTGELWIKATGIFLDRNRAHQTKTKTDKKKKKGDTCCCCIYSSRYPKNRQIYRETSSKLPLTNERTILAIKVATWEERKKTFIMQAMMMLQKRKERTTKGVISSSAVLLLY